MALVLESLDTLVLENLKAEREKWEDGGSPEGMEESSSSKLINWPAG